MIYLILIILLLSSRWCCFSLFIAASCNSHRICQAGKFLLTLQHYDSCICFHCSSWYNEWEAALSFLLYIIRIKSNSLIASVRTSYLSDHRIWWELRSIYIYNCSVLILYVLSFSSETYQCKAIKYSKCFAILFSHLYELEATLCYCLADLIFEGKKEKRKRNTDLHDHSMRIRVPADPGKPRLLVKSNLGK